MNDWCWRSGGRSVGCSISMHMLAHLQCKCKRVLSYLNVYCHDAQKQCSDTSECVRSRHSEGGSDSGLNDWYESLPMPKKSSENPLKFWKNHCWQMPYISCVALWVYSIPPSSAALERLFSAAGRAITRRRCRMKPRNAARLLFGHANVSRGIIGRAKTST